MVATDSTAIIAESQERHDSDKIATTLLGRVFTATPLLAHVLLKNPDDRVTVRVAGDGPLGSIIAEGGLDGRIRGYSRHPRLAKTAASPDVDTVADVDLQSAIGKGDLEIIRSHAPHGDPYKSSSYIVNGGIAEDVAYYLAQSEQINSAVLIGEHFEGEKIARAGGVILQALPDVDPAALTLLEANIKAFGSISEQLSKLSLQEIIEELCWGMEVEVLTQEPLPLVYQCRCSDEKALDALAYFTPADREAMIAEDGGAEVVCHWCNERRWLGPEKLRSISQNEIRCPDCNTLWFREGQATMVRENARCACGRKVELDSEEHIQENTQV